MRLTGLHHVTMITGDAPANVDFHADVLGLRLVNKTVNFDQPQAYHLYFGDERGSPGSILTWFEFAGAPPGQAGAGMIHTIQLGVASEDALDFWAQRLGDWEHESTPGDGSLRFAGPDGLALELVVAGGDPPLRAVHPEIPAEHAITGSRAPAPTPRRAAAARSCSHTRWASPAWATARIAWRGPSAVRDRDDFRSIYFREPSGVLFEIATLSPGFAVDEPAERLGEQLRLPAQHEHLRGELERTLTPVVNPRAARREEALS